MTAPPDPSTLHGFADRVPTGSTRPRHQPMREEDGRCPWCGTDPLYIAYHDAEWSVPVVHPKKLFEKLILDGFQAGLAWITILRKRSGFLEAFDGLDPERMHTYGESDVERLMTNPRIVRNRAKIRCAIASARAWLAIMDEPGGFTHFVWSTVGGTMRINQHRTHSDLPAATAESAGLSRRLRLRGFGFCGPTIVYAFMQATGLVNDHLVGCPRHAACRSLGAAVRVPAPHP